MLTETEAASKIALCLDDGVGSLCLALSGSHMGYFCMVDCIFTEYLVNFFTHGCVLHCIVMALSASLPKGFWSG